MKVLLTAINAKYIHSNLAVYTLKAYAAKYQKQIQTAEFTINHQTDEIIQEIYKQKPDIIAFSCYIWNITIVKEAAEELHKLLPNTHIWLGGPEASYNAQDLLAKQKSVKGIMIGEGEKTFLDLMDHYNRPNSQITLEQDSPLQKIPGIAFRDERTGKILYTEKRELLELNQIPFPYPWLTKKNDNSQPSHTDFENKILYYESSRGALSPVPIVYPPLKKG